MKFYFQFLFFHIKCLFLGSVPEKLTLYTADIELICELRPFVNQ